MFPSARPLRSAVRGTLMLATALGMTLLAGHFQIAAYVWIFAALYAIIRLLGLAVARDRQRTRRLLAAAGVAVALAAMLAMTQLLPTLELGGLSARGAGKPSAAGFEFHRQRAVQPMELLGLLQADFLGTPVDGSYKGISYSEHCPYVGATTLLLGLVGLAVGRRRKHLWLFFGLAVFALWGAMAGPPAMLLYWGVPKLGQAGGFSRLLSVWTLAAALWGGAGLQALLDRLTASSGPTVGRGLVPRRPLSATPEDGAVQARAPQKTTAVPMAVALLALFLLAAEMLPWAYRFNPRAAAATVYPETEAIRKLRELTGSDRYVAVNNRRKWGLADVPAGVVLPPNAATVYGIRCVDGYDSLFPAAYRQAAAFMEKTDPSPLANGNMLLPSDPAPWALVGAKAVVGADEQAPHPVSWHGDGVSIRVNDGQSPPFVRAWCNRATSPQGPFYRATLLQDGLNAVVLDPNPPAVPPYVGPVERASVALLEDSPYPGWHAYSGAPATEVPIYQNLKLNGRSAAVSSETHHLSFVYYPASVACGLFVTLLALAALTALGTSALRRHRA